MWFVEPSFSSGGAGLLLLDRAIRNSQALCGFNLNETSETLYGSNGALFLKEVPRYFAILNSAGTRLLRGEEAAREHRACVADFWCTSTRFSETLHAAGFRRHTATLGVPMIFTDISLNRRPLNACILL